MSKLPDNLKMQTTNPPTPGASLKTMQENNELQSQANKSIGGTRKRRRRRQRGGDMQAAPLPTGSNSSSSNTNTNVNNVYKQALVANTQGAENAKYDKVEVKGGKSKRRRTKKTKRRTRRRTRRN